MRPLPLGKYKRATPADRNSPGTPTREIVCMPKIEERSREVAWDVELARHRIAVRRWRGTSALPGRCPVESVRAC